MRIAILGVGLLLVAIGVVIAWPYRLEQITGRVASNSTGCVVKVANTNGWKPSSGQMLAEEQLVERVSASVSVYECPGIPGGKPVAVTLLAPDTGYRAQGCGGRPDDAYCGIELPRIPTAADVHRYQLLIQLRPGEPPKAVDLEVRRESEWRSGGFDALMSV